MRSINKGQVNMNLNFKFKPGVFLRFYLCWFLPTNKSKIYFDGSDMVLIFLSFLAARTQRNTALKTENYCTTNHKKGFYLLTANFRRSQRAPRQEF
jgi:hypothetical protein